MLKKLLKYDLQNIFKFLIIFYGLALFFGILTRIFLSIDNSFIMNLIGQICSGACISMMFSILINNLMRLWVRFKQNLYGDESYLIHTLPVDKKVLYLIQHMYGGTVKQISNALAFKYKLRNRAGLIELINDVNGLIRNPTRLLQMNKLCVKFNIELKYPNNLLFNNG